MDDLVLFLLIFMELGSAGKFCKLEYEKHLEDFWKCHYGQIG